MKAQIEKAVAENDGKIIITELIVDRMPGSLKPQYIPWNGRHLPSGKIDFDKELTPVEAHELENGYGMPFEGNGYKEHIFSKLPGLSEKIHGPVSMSVKRESNESDFLTVFIEYNWSRHNQILAAKKVEGRESLNRDTLPDTMTINLVGFGSVELARKSNLSFEYHGVVGLEGVSNTLNKISFDYARPANQWPPVDGEPSLSFKASQIEIEQKALVTEIFINDEKVSDEG